MPIVFVHGINVRVGDSTEWTRNRQDLLGNQFRRAFASRLPKDVNAVVRTPYWGDLGVKFPRDLCYLPRTGVQSLGLQNEAARAVLASLGPDLPEDYSQRPLVTLSRARSLGGAIDLLFAVGATVGLAGILTSEQASDANAEAAAFAEAASRYADAHPSPTWLDELKDDEMFLKKLLEEVPAFSRQPARSTGLVQSLGLGDRLEAWLENAADAARAATKAVKRELVSMIRADARAGFNSAFDLVRPRVSMHLSRFVGDIMVYMEDREPILARVAEAIDVATREATPGDEELFLIGHSFGGLILFDLLSSYRSDLNCGLLVTAGSQVALFGELDRFREKSTVSQALADRKVLAQPPGNTKRWLNVYDRTDILGFPAGGLFQGVWDFEFVTDAFPLVSHGAYFDTPRFFNRLHDRIEQAYEAGDTSGPIPPIP